MTRLILLLAALSLPAAAQDRTAWMRYARWGVMTHYLADWIARAAGEPMTVEKWNALVDGFDVEALAGQLQSVGAGYYPSPSARTPVTISLPTPLTSASRKRVSARAATWCRTCPRRSPNAASG